MADVTITDETIETFLTEFFDEYDTATAEAMGGFMGVPVEDLRKDARRSLTAALAQAPTGVKALRWRDQHAGLWVAEPFPGFEYRIIQDARIAAGFTWFVAGTWRDAASLADAKAAAQADYETRIRSALTQDTGQKSGDRAAQGTPADEQSGETSPALSSPAQGQREGVRKAVLALPRRSEKISGQSFSYVKLDDVLALLTSHKEQDNA